jgi:hypothetical protein
VHQLEGSFNKTFRGFGTVEVDDELKLTDVRLMFDPSGALVPMKELGTCTKQ